MLPVKYNELVQSRIHMVFRAEVYDFACEILRRALNSLSKTFKGRHLLRLSLFKYGYFKET